MFIILLSCVVRVVIRKPILVTVPTWFDTSMISPTLKLLCPSMNIPEMKFDRVSLAAKPTAIPTIPKLRTNALTSIPSS